MDILLQDLRYAVRSLSHAKGFTAVVALVIGLAIGANVLVFAMVDGMMFKPWPLPGIERVVAVRMPVRTGTETTTPFRRRRTVCPLNTGMTACVGTIKASSILRRRSSMCTKAPGKSFPAELPQIARSWRVPIEGSIFGSMA